MATRDEKKDIKKREKAKRKSRIKTVNVNDLTLNFNMENIEMIMKEIKSAQTGKSLYESSKYKMRYDHLIERCNDNSDLASLTKNEVIKK